MGSKKMLNGGHSGLECNIAILGALGVGKSALTVKYITRRYIMEYDPTLEDTYTKAEHIDGQDATLRIMDTYDKEGSDTDRYLKWAHAFIVVYSITCRSSFQQAKDYLYVITEFQKSSNKDIPVAVVGNKVDLERYRVVSKSEGAALAAQYDSTFHETAAAEEYQSVENVFVCLVREITGAADRHSPLLPLYISEETGRMSLKRSKSPKSVDPTKEKKDENGKDKSLPRRSGSNFRFFNKGFKIFN